MKKRHIPLTALLLSLTGSLLIALSLPKNSLAHGGESHEPPVKSSAPKNTPPATRAQGQRAPSEAAVRLPDGRVFVPKSAQREFGIRTQMAEQGTFPKTIELNGRVIAAPNAGGRVQTFQSGRIEAGPNGLAVLGQPVKKGQVLAWLHPASTALERGSQQAALAEMASQESILARRFARLQQLQGSVPQKDIEQAEIELQAFQKRKHALETSLGREPLTAPVNGVISAMNAAVGQVVDARTVVFEIIDPHRLAVEALAYDPALLEGLGKATAPINGGVLNLVFVGLGRTLKEQAMPVLFNVIPPNKGEPLAVPVGQTVKVLAQTQSVQQGMAIPASAVVRNAANETVVWVHERPEHFVSHRVTVTPLDGLSVLLIKGLAEPGRVVVQGATALTQIR